LQATVSPVDAMAGKIFKMGNLMYGKRPSLREVFYWLMRR